MDILEYVAKNPGSSSVIAVALLTFAGQAAITWDTIRYMKRNMVTRKDLEIAMLRFEKAMRRTFVAKSTGLDFSVGSDESDTL